LGGDRDIRAVFQGDYAWNMQVSVGVSWTTAYFKDSP